MRFQKSEKIELKSIVTEDIKKEAIAFANTQGGKVYIGIENDGKVIGVKDPDHTCLQISNMMRDSIKPDITMFIHYETFVENDKFYICMDIQRGTNRPYYLSKKGMRPEGVYVRQGYSSVPASDAAIRRMIKETDGDHFESLRCLIQTLTFRSAQKEFELRNIPFGPQQMHTLKLLDSDGLYTNLAFLLSDQCTHTIKVAVFQGVDQSIFIDRKEFEGSLLHQMNEIYTYLEIHNQTHAEFSGLYRIDTKDYPAVALREALLNILVHRDYSFQASSFIRLYEDRIEFISIGGLVSGLELEDVITGISVCRNEALASIFYRLHLIEAYGTGMEKIMNAYEKSERKPKLEVTKNTFKITLPNQNVNTHPSPVIQESSIRYASDLSREEALIMELAQKNHFLNRHDVMDVLQVSSSTATRILGKMVKKNLLKQIGKARNTRYHKA